MQLAMSFEQNGKSVELLKSGPGWLLRIFDGEEKWVDCETCQEALDQFDVAAWGMKRK